MNDKKETLNQQLFVITDFKQSSRIIESNNDISILRNSQNLYEISQKALEKPIAVTLKDPFVNVKEDIELMHICRMIDPSYSSASSKAIKSSKYTSGGYKPTAIRAKSKDRGNEGLKSSSLLKKGYSANGIIATNKGFAQSPNKPKPVVTTNVQVSNSYDESDPPNYTKPIGNKRKNKTNVVDDEPEIPNKAIKSLYTQSLANPDAILRVSVDSNKKKPTTKPKGAYDWKKMDSRDGISHEAKYTNTSKDRKDAPHVIKKSTSLYEARNKRKNDRAKIDKLRPKEGSTDDNQDVANIPKLNPTKSSPVNENFKNNIDEDNMFSLPSYRQHDGKLNDVFDTPDNWEVSRIEKHSEFEKSFKKEVHNILPEETKKYGYEVEKRLIGLEGDDEDNFIARPGNLNNVKVKKVPASPASDDKFGYSMITSNKDTSKHDLSRMMITVDQYIYVISGYKNTTLSSVER